MNRPSDKTVGDIHSPAGNRGRVARWDKPAAGEAATCMGLSEGSPDSLFARPLARLELWILRP